MAHALLSASASERWINCPPSARLTERMPDRSTPYATEGTLAHAIAENRLRHARNPSDRDRLDAELEELKTHPQYANSMLDYVAQYVDTVLEKYHEAKARTRDAMLLIEARLDFSEYVPEGFGTGDAVIIADQLAEIIDLKYGQGVPVYAFENSQMRLYAAGMLHTHGFLFNVREVKTTIVQPRLDHISSELLTVPELEDWLQTTVRPRALLAYKGRGDYLAGAHCRFCKAKAQCRARAETNMQLLDYGFKHPNLMGNDEIGPILVIAEQLGSWVKNIQDYAFDQLTHGNEVPGWKLVEGRSNRTITDKEQAIEILTLALGETDTLESIIKPTELRGLGDLEKHFGKKTLSELLEGLIEKPPGKPTMVPESDSRPKLNSLVNEFENENFDDYF